MRPSHFTFPLIISAFLLIQARGSSAEQDPARVGTRNPMTGQAFSAEQNPDGSRSILMTENGKAVVRGRIAAPGLESTVSSSDLTTGQTATTAIGPDGSVTFRVTDAQGNLIHEGFAGGPDNLVSVMSRNAPSGRMVLSLLDAERRCRVVVTDMNDNLLNDALLGPLSEDLSVTGKHPLSGESIQETVHPDGSRTVVRRDRSGAVTGEENYDKFAKITGQAGGEQKNE